MRYIAICLFLANLGYLGWALIWPGEPRPPAGGAGSDNLLNTGITLVSEFQGQTGQEAGGAMDQGLVCSRVTGLQSMDMANGLMAEARRRGLQAWLELTGERLPSQFRVYLPPASSRGVATIILDGLGERLAENDLAIDSYLITRGLLENAIALGVFSQRESAEQVRNRVRGLGYAPEIEEIPRSDGELVVWLKPTASERVGDAEWLDLTAERPVLERSENLCQTIAQASQFP